METKSGLTSNLFTNTGVFIMVFNVYLHFFDESRPWDDVVWGCTKLYLVVRSGTML